MKFKKVFSLALIATMFGISCGFTSCTSSQTVIEYNNTPTSIAPTTFASADDLSTMAESHLSAMATVYLTKDGSSTPTHQGSGVAVADGGFLVTNYHVIYNYINHPDTYSLNLAMLITEEGETTPTIHEEVPASLIWYDASLDLAILRSSQNFEKIVPISDRWISCSNLNKLKIAEQVWTLGTPAELSLFGTFSMGTISSSYYRNCATEVNSIFYVHDYMIQHNASISSGSSGGGLFDVKGNLIGLNTCGNTASSFKESFNDLYYAIPIYPVTKILSKVTALELDGDPNTNYTSAGFGVTSCYDKGYKDYNTDCTFSEDGVFVAEISKNSNGAKAGVKMGSVITGISNANTDSTDASYKQILCKYDYIYALLNYNVGDTITLHFSNSGTPKTAQITLE